MKSKKLVMLLAVLGIFFLFSPAVSAHSGDDCGCAGTTGPEKNKLVSNLLKSDEFKEKKKILKKDGYHWNGVNGTEIDYNEEINEYLIAIPVLTPDRTEEHYLLYALGEFKGPFPKEFTD